jgi:hypothetical protein
VEGGGRSFNSSKTKIRREIRKFSLGDFDKSVLRIKFLEYYEQIKETSTSRKLFFVEKLNLREGGTNFSENTARDRILF